MAATMRFAAPTNRIERYGYFHRCCSVRKEFVRLIEVIAAHMFSDEFVFGE